MTETARKRLADLVSKVKKDEETAMKGGSSGHRQRAVMGKQNAELRIVPSEYHPVVNQVLEQGFTIHIAPGRTPEIKRARITQRDAWGLNAEELRRHGSEIDWPDEEMLFFLKWGFYDYSAETPPVSTFSSHQKRHGIADTLRYRRKSRGGGSKRRSPIRHQSPSK